MATPNAAHNVAVKFYSASNPMVAEPTTPLGGNVYQITDAARRVLDPSVAITVSVGTITAIDYLFGKITTDSGSTPTVSANRIDEDTDLKDNVMDVGINLSRTVHDITAYEDTDRVKLLGLNDLSVTFGFHGDADGNIEAWHSGFIDNPGTVRVVAEVDLLDGLLFRAWLSNSVQDITAPIDDLVQFAITLEINPQASVEPELSGVDRVAFGFGT